MSINAFPVASRRKYSSTLPNRQSSQGVADSPFPIPRVTRARSGSTPLPPPQPLPAIPRMHNQLHGRSASVATSRPYHRAPQTLEHPSHGLDSYALRERPSAPLLSMEKYLEKGIRSRSGSTRSAPTKPCTSVVSKRRGTSEISATPVVPEVSTRYGRVPTPIGCLPGRSLRVEDWVVLRDRRGNAEGIDGCYSVEESSKLSRLGEVGRKMKNIWRGLHVNVSVSFRERGGVMDHHSPRLRQIKQQMTLRVKNNEIGSCVFEIIKHVDTGAEILTPIDDLKQLFPYSKNLRRTLHEWNWYYQNPPQHWVINFIPRAYLKRGYTLSQDVFEYFNGHADGCEYRIEYEPIGHHFCHVGTTVSKPSRRSGKASDLRVENGGEKHLRFA
ncbi:Similar to hypothetical protein [Tuber melanosporum Mel28]; acc. no. XP_002839961 [Pyronema omphalodes CBS 100304]|uniref:Uncharacterized protein n=1 Tax=Pyronema omphalodes (strain CBS 100304) TaxID=1076935 RepID=U4L055_PYROM|nr:Similar to hypothetical protein [Tuber melanosporum Mel28]; acc. no. XP_002839961 [Pyronema omphalodes CBS 100304]